jgi:transposase
VPDEPVPDDAAGLRAANARLRVVVESQAAEIEGLRAGRDAGRELIRRLGLRLTELERRLGMDSTDSGIPSSKERIGAKEARRAGQQSERERRKDRKPGGQPGHQGKGLQRDPNPGSGRPRIRRRSAAPAGPGWQGRPRPWSRGGRRSSTSR